MRIMYTQWTGKSSSSQNNAHVTRTCLFYVFSWYAENDLEILKS